VNKDEYIYIYIYIYTESGSTICVPSCMPHSAPVFTRTQNCGTSWITSFICQPIQIGIQDLFWQGSMSVIWFVRTPQIQSRTWIWSIHVLDWIWSD